MPQIMYAVSRPCSAAEFAKADKYSPIISGATLLCFHSTHSVSCGSVSSSTNRADSCPAVIRCPPLWHWSLSSFICKHREIDFRVKVNDIVFIGSGQMKQEK